MSAWLFKLVMQHEKYRTDMEIQVSSGNAIVEIRNAPKIIIRNRKRIIQRTVSLAHTVFDTRITNEITTQSFPIMDQRYGARAHRKVDVFRTMYRVVTSINQPNSRPWAGLAAVTIAEISAFYVSIVLHRKKAPAGSSFATQPSVGWLQSIASHPVSIVETSLPVTWTEIREWFARYFALV